MSRFNGRPNVWNGLRRHLTETVSYTPKGGSASDVVAIIDRGGLQVSGTDADVVTYDISIKVSQSDIDEVTVNGDKVALKRVIDDTSNTTMTVAFIVSDVGGMWHLALR